MVIILYLNRVKLLRLQSCNFIFNHHRHRRRHVYLKNHVDDRERFTVHRNAETVEDDSPQEIDDKLPCWMSG